MNGTNEPTPASPPEALTRRVNDLEDWADQLSERLGDLLALADPPGGRKPPPQNLQEMIELLESLPRFRKRG